MIASFTYTVSGVSGGYFQLSSAPGTPITTFTSADLAGGLVQFVDDGDEVAPAFSVTVNDGAVDSNTLAATITYTPVNDAPTANIGPIGFGVNEDDGPRPLGGFSVGDIDVGGGDLAVTLSVNDGKITLGNTTGLTFTNGANGTASMTFTATVANANNALASIRYAGDPNFHGTDTITLSVDDQGNTGSGGPLTRSDTANITVSSVNDAPLNSVPGPQVTSEDTALVFSGGNGNLISVSDIDAGGNTVQATLEARRHAHPERRSVVLLSASATEPTTAT